MSGVSSHQNLRPKIAVAMSGGVDSSVVAGLLCKEGHDVFGVYMRNWRDDDRTPECTTIRDWLDVRRVCDRLKIECRYVEFSDLYKKKVFEPFLEDLRKGLTPNPDIMCNHHIKFNALKYHVRNQGADILATGHYARIRTEHANQTSLYMANDKSKCQTYFLFACPDLEDCMMPLGDIQKTQVRTLARKMNLHNHAKKDSTGLCFIGERDFGPFIARYLEDQPGDIVDANNKKLGRHRGLFHHTIGQRKGLGIGGMREQKHEGEAWYVIDKDTKNNRLIVACGKQNPCLYSDAAVIRDILWLGTKPSFPLDCAVKIRYRMESVPCRLSDEGKDTLFLQFHEKQRAVTPGQAAVFYQGERCLGGGFISETSEKKSVSSSFFV